MYIIKKNDIITLTRGDYFEFTLPLIEGDFPFQKEYSLSDEDIVFFGIMLPHQPFETALFKKEYTKDDVDSENNLIIKLEPEDTIGMMPGNYYYSIKRLYEVDGEPRINTIIGKTKFILVD